MNCDLQLEFLEKIISGGNKMDKTIKNFIALLLVGISVVQMADKLATAFKEKIAKEVDNEIKKMEDK